MSESRDSEVSEGSSPTATELSIAASANTFGDGSSHRTDSPRTSHEAASTQSLASPTGTVRSDVANSSNPDSISPTTSGLGEKRKLDSSNSSPEKSKDEDVLAEIESLDQQIKEVDERLNNQIAAANACKHQIMAKKRRLEEKLKKKVRRKCQTHFTGGISSFLKHRFKSNYIFYFDLFLDSAYVFVLSFDLLKY
jgi:hypothetical protein